ncbi:hypothetical protein Q0601_23170 [Paracoccus onubensis]|uniref:hypothetical protein n=1 Tax=Paracoccus onubensis TaxID=1675788 RepID=UPI002730B751|nr:hypothetical protein [Paracoccus onubensis]MDP0930087.1 hypothetical protein [Paracoccus onubensis]
MKQQIDAFNAALTAFDTYAQILHDAAVAVRAGDRRDDLIVSLMRSETDVLPPDIVDKLIEGAVLVKEAAPRIQNLLAKPDVNQAILSVLAHSRNLDRSLERTLDLQSPSHARVPPPYRFFEKYVVQLRAAFPRAVGTPFDTPQKRAFQHYLETVNNPWR